MNSSTTTIRGVVVSMSDLIDREARAMAKDLLERELAKQDLPLPKDTSLDIHIDALIEGDPTIKDRARLRVEAKQDAFTLSMQALGIESPRVEVIDTADLKF